MPLWQKFAYTGGCMITSLIILGGLLVGGWFFEKWITTDPCEVNGYYVNHTIPFVPSNTSNQTTQSNTGFWDTPRWQIVWKKNNDTSTHHYRDLSERCTPPEPMTVKVYFMNGTIKILRVESGSVFSIAARKGEKRDPIILTGTHYTLKYNETEAKEL
jgi:hypothetical protein